MPSKSETYTLGIAEKPQAAKRIARALDEKGKPSVKRLNNVPVYTCTRNEKKIVVVPAIGHLFTLKQIGKTWNYPALDYEWVPTHTVDKTARTKNFVSTFSSLRKKASNVIIMTDYDREGEVIGYIILKYLLKKNQAERMKFSTLTRWDILEAYDNREKELNLGFLNSGLIRHYIDWLYGINYSRALSLSLKHVAEKFKTISIGRVQGPTLAFVVEKENYINLFVPKPYWIIDSEVRVNKETCPAFYEKARIDTKKEAQNIVKECNNLIGAVKDVEENQKNIPPRPPFNLSDLQREAYKHFKFSPSKTLDFAEVLYLKALISYPRTDSQKLPMTLGHKRILTNLTKNGSYKTYCIEIIERKRFKPFEGRKKDAAHPAIHPTGNLIGENLSLNEKKLYDLIVKRYLAVFGERAKQVNKNIVININSHHFEIRGSHIVKEGWIKYYKTYVSYLDISIPDLKLGEKIFFNFINEKEHFTEPTRRFNESTLLKMMEDEQIGTKATRAGIIKTLFGRGYVVGSVIKPTPLGIAVIEVLQKHYPIIVKPDMTRNLELLMENVQEEKTSVDEAILSKKKELKDMLLEFHKKESEIGIALNMNLLTSEKKSFINLGACPECKVGELRIIHSKKTGKRFIACSSYKNSSIKCEVTYPLPPYGEINRTNKICQFDGLPLMEWKRGRKKEHVCIDFHCLSRKEVGKNGNKTE